ncbi:thrombospondin type-1 domain-containing protein 7B-like isoform X2 [Panulirus ornatus]
MVSAASPWWGATLLLGLWAACHAHARDTHDYGDYSWNTGAWGVCWSERGCGLGSEERTVWCGDIQGRPLPPTLCRHQERPPNSRTCYAACSDGSWQVGWWSPCQVGQDRSRDVEGLCQGRRTRNITCEVQGAPAAADQCSNPPPSTEASCATACPQDCVVGPWGSWVPCVSCDASQSRTRSVLVAPTPGGRPCPPLSESRPCIAECLPSGVSPALSGEKEEPLVRLRVGEWGPCQTSLTPSRDDVEEPTNIEENSIFFAKDKGATLPEVGDDEDLRETNSIGELSRIRSGRTLGDTQPTQTEEWASGHRSKGLPRVGRQERELSCVHVNGTRLLLSVCLTGRGRVAERVRTCVVDQDCVVTQWSSWSTVVPGCVAPSGLVVREVRERRRTSSALQHGGGVPCPHLLERHTLPDPSLQPCDTRYQWVSSAWGACVASVGQEEAVVQCGGGVQTRQLTCVRAADHVPVLDELCVHVEPPPRVQRCEVGCERDCVVGPWSAWGVCTPTDCTASPPPATPGFQRRRRQVVVTPSLEGTECPPLEEQSECHEAQCHQWVLGDWSACVLTNPSRSCGSGHQLRNASCLDSAGVSNPSCHA